MRVLVAEDQAKLAQTVAVGLRREGMAVDIALDGREALDEALVTSYDVIVLDRDLPAVHGDDVCRQLIARGCESRILMLTAASTIEDRVDGWAWVPTTTCPSRSRSPSSRPGSGRWPGAPGRRSRRSWSVATCGWTQASGSPPGPDAGSR